MVSLNWFFTGNCLSKPVKWGFNVIFEEFLGQFSVILAFILTKVNPRNFMVIFVFFVKILEPLKSGIKCQKISYLEFSVYHNKNVYTFSKK